MPGLTEEEKKIEAGKQLRNADNLAAVPRRISNLKEFFKGKNEFSKIDALEKAFSASLAAHEKAFAQPPKTRKNPISEEDRAIFKRAVIDKILSDLDEGLKPFEAQQLAQVKKSKKSSKVTVDTKVKENFGMSLYKNFLKRSRTDSPTTGIPSTPQQKKRKRF